VTHNRAPILIEHSDLLWRAIREVQDGSPFELLAWVVLPDHFHVIIDPKEFDLSHLTRRIKLKFSSRYRFIIGMKSGRVWQNRFWDHILRDQEDLNRHIDYIHYNPVKHGLADGPLEWEHSSFQAYRRRGFYSDEWGVTDDPTDGEAIGE
jgi:putative transposase